MGAFGRGDPSVAFFYLITGLHGAAYCGRPRRLGRTGAKWARGTRLPTIRPSVELCTVYWHFLLRVWLVLFGLLFLRHDLGAPWPLRDQVGLESQMTTTAPDRRVEASRAGWQGTAPPTGPRTRRVQERPLGEGHDVDLPPERHLHFRLLPASYMTVRMSTTVPWPNPSEVFALPSAARTFR